MQAPIMKHMRHRSFDRSQRSRRLKSWLQSQATRLTQTPAQIFELLRFLTAKEVSVLVSATNPLNITAPHIAGYIIQGQTLTVTDKGLWELADTYAYQWKRGGVNISGATSASYTLVIGDVAANISCVVTATNETGSTTANSQTVGSIQPIATAVSDAYLVRG